MARKKQGEEEPPQRSRVPAKTSEEQERINIGLAEELAERQLRDGSASAQVQIHYLKMGTEQYKLEQRRLEGEIELQKAKIEAIAQQGRIEELFTRAIDAFTTYRPPDYPDFELPQAHGQD